MYDEAVSSIRIVEEKQMLFSITIDLIKVCFETIFFASITDDLIRHIKDVWYSGCVCDEYCLVDETRQYNKNGL